MAVHSSTLAWKIPWKEEPDRLQSTGSQRVGHDWATSLSLSFKVFCFFAFFFSWKVKHLLAQKAKNIDSPYREEAPWVLVWPPQSSGNHFTFWGEKWGTQGWDKPTSESSTAGHPALQLLLALAKYAFSWAGLPSAAYLWHHHPCVTENYWKLRQQGKAD